MDAEQVLSEYMDRYRNLVIELGRDASETKETLHKLKDLVVVEAYFMKSVRLLLDDDEMAGFILYIDRDMQTVFDLYRPQKGEFLPYLRESMENKALNYKESLSRGRNIRTSYIRFNSVQSMAVSESSPEDILIATEEKAQQSLETGRTVDCLRRMCLQNPTRTAKLFVFFCTLLPFLSVDIIDGFCSALNIDRRQTFAIADYLCQMQEIENGSRYSKVYLQRALEYHWTKVLELDAHARNSLNPKPLQEKADFHRKRHLESIDRYKEAKMNIPYSIVGELLNMATSKVSLCVLHSKNMLQKAILECDKKPSRRMARVKDRSLPRFEPFLVFGINLIDRPA